MTLYTFQSLPSSAKATFDCPSCGKKNRTRTFRGECTVNPFNKKENGEVRTPREVRQQSKERANALREQFLRKPLCATCENSLPHAELHGVLAERRSEHLPAQDA